MLEILSWWLLNTIVFYVSMVCCVFIGFVVLFICGHLVDIPKKLVLFRHIDINLEAEEYASRCLLVAVFWLPILIYILVVEEKSND